MPGTREMMNSALATAGGMPMSPHTAAIAPSMLTGSGGGRRARDRCHLDGADHLHVIPFDLELQRHLEEPRGAGVARVEAMAEAGDGAFGLDARCRR